MLNKDNNKVTDDMFYLIQNVLLNDLNQLSKTCPLEKSKIIFER